MKPSGLFKRAFPGVCILPLTLCAAFAQAPGTVTRCQVTSSPVLVRSEGLTEPVGDVVFRCSSNPGATFTGNFTMSLPVPVTNRIDASNMTRDAVLAVDL